MQSKLAFIVLVAIVTVLTGVTGASAQLPSGERQLGQTILEPGYDDRTGNLIYIMTPVGAPNPSHANAHAVSPLYLIVYPNSAADSVGTMNCAHEGGDNCPDHGPAIADLAQAVVPGVYGNGVWGHDHIMAGPGGSEFNVAWHVVVVLFTRGGQYAHHDRGPARRRARRWRCLHHRNAHHLQLQSRIPRHIQSGNANSAGIPVRPMGACRVDMRPSAGFLTTSNPTNNARSTHAGFVADTIQVEPFRLTWPSGAESGARVRSTASRMTGRCSTPTSRTRREVGPIRTAPSAAERGVAPRNTAASKRCTSIASKPAPDKMARNLSVSANANGPGASGSAGAGVIPIAARAAERGVIAHALSRGVRQQTNTHRPSLRSDLRKWLNAWEGWLKNITPKRENSKSVFPGSSAWDASPSRKVTCACFSNVPRERATASIGCDTSMPRTAPDAPTIRASSIEVSPHPHPMSITRSPGCGAAAFRAATPNGTTMPSISRCIAAHRSPNAPFHSAICSELSAGTDRSRIVIEGRAEDYSIRIQGVGSAPVRPIVGGGGFLHFGDATA